MALCASLAFGETVHPTSQELWPELSAYLSLGRTTRLYLDAAYAKGEDSPSGTADLSGFVDISLRPIRRRFRYADWQRSRFLWARIGYDEVVDVTDGALTSVEHRGIVSLLAKFGFPADIWLEARARADLRWIGDEYSTRYRGRLEATREFAVFDHSVVPYANVEWFYDTRYGGMARTLYMLGSEVSCTEHFRFEIYGARQNDRLPSVSSLNVLGLVAKWYY